MRTLEAKDVRWLWAAWRKGDLAEFIANARAVGLAPPADTRASFDAWVAGLVSSFEVYAIAAPNPQAPKDEPLVIVGLVGIDRVHAAFMPRFWWMSWATARNKIEGSVRFLVDTRKEGVVLFHERDETFMKHMARYHLTRRVGFIPRYYHDRATAHIWRSI